MMHLHLSSPPAWSIKGRYAQRAQDAVPGPGSYQPSLSWFNSSPSFKVGSSLRQDLAGSTTSPGPGAYSPSRQGTGPQYSIKGRNPHANAEAQPGPGSYNASDRFTKQRPQSAKMGNASRADLPTDTVRSNFPGPGSYMQDFAGLGPAWRFGNESRSKAQLDGHPGPGSYQLQSTLSKQAYSLSGRCLKCPATLVLAQEPTGLST